MALGRIGAIALLAVGGMLLKKKLGQQQQQDFPQRLSSGRPRDLPQRQLGDPDAARSLPQGTLQGRSAAM